MAAKDVALASSIFIPKIAISVGTITIPPPIPNKPDIMPAKTPTIKIPISIPAFFLIEAQKYLILSNFGEHYPNKKGKCILSFFVDQSTANVNIPI